MVPLIIRKESFFRSRIKQSNEKASVHVRQWFGFVDLIDVEIKFVFIVLTLRESSGTLHIWNLLRRIPSQEDLLLSAPLDGDSFFLRLNALMLFISPWSTLSRQTIAPNSYRGISGYYYKKTSAAYPILMEWLRNRRHRKRECQTVKLRYLNSFIQRLFHSLIRASLL